MSLIETSILRKKMVDGCSVEGVYIIIGAMLGLIWFVVRVLWPLAHLWNWQISNFINDVEPPEEADPYVLVVKRFPWMFPWQKGAVSKSSGADGVLVAISLEIWASIMIVFIWFPAAICAMGYAMLHFLRLASRLERHAADIGVHVEKKG